MITIVDPLKNQLRPFHKQLTIAHQALVSLVLLRNEVLWFLIYFVGFSTKTHFCSILGTVFFICNIFIVDSIFSYLKSNISFYWHNVSNLVWIKKFF